jgi:hypothetical protein
MTDKDYLQKLSIDVNNCKVYVLLIKFPGLDHRKTCNREGRRFQGATALLSPLRRDRSRSPWLVPRVERDTNLQSQATDESLPGLEKWGKFG